MIKVKIPDDNLPEREYALRILLSDFLGLTYTLITSDSQRDYSLVFDDKELIINDEFFRKYRSELSYLTTDALPKDVTYAKNRFVFENDIPVIYGKDKIEVADKKLICGIDIFASSFFMLTRWEEFVIKKRDQHGRFPGNESFVWRNTVLHRPIVNEYVEMLWNMLVSLGYKGERKTGNPELILTHDVDTLTYASYRTVLGDLIKRRNPLLAVKSFKYAISNDPFDTYDFLMTISERLGVKSHFYFMATDSGLKYDTSWYVKRRKFKSLVKSIKERGHIIGFHPGYYTYNKPDRWHYEKMILEDAIQQEVKEGRQHFLRMDIPKTFSIWENNNMEIDSSLGYSGREGFRCGTGDTFPIFDFLERKQLNLKERPLIIMDGMLKSNQDHSVDKAKETIHYYTSLIKKYKTGITILFHNSSFFGEWEGYDSVYRELLNM